MTWRRDDGIGITCGEILQSIAQRWQTEKFRERFGKPLFKGVFHDASMHRIEAPGGTFLKKRFPPDPFPRLSIEFASWWFIHWRILKVE